MKTPIRIDGVHEDFVAGVVEAFGLNASATAPDLDAALAPLLERRTADDFPPAELKAGIRDLLRAGGYKPSGRGKPANEYLAAAARKGTFPRISTLVDTANRYSLLTGLPISLVDRDAALVGTDGLVLRLGAPGESYVFNPAGQEIDVAGLICVARDGGAPVGNPVKDSLATRTNEATTNVIAVIYASVRVVPVDVIERMAAQLGAEIARHTGATDVASAVLAAGNAGDTRS